MSLSYSCKFRKHKISVSPRRRKKWAALITSMDNVLMYQELGRHIAYSHNNTFVTEHIIWYQSCLYIIDFPITEHQPPPRKCWNPDCPLMEAFTVYTFMGGYGIHSASYYAFHDSEQGEVSLLREFPQN